MIDVFICDYMRMPIGRYTGSLASVRPDDLGAAVLQSRQERNPKIDWEAVDEVVFACANHGREEKLNVAQMSLLLAGLSISVTGTPINHLCGSCTDVVLYAARAV